MAALRESSHRLQNEKLYMAPLVPQARGPHMRVAHVGGQYDVALMHSARGKACSATAAAFYKSKA